MKKMEFTRKQAWELLWDGVAFLAGSFLFAVAVNVFTAPNNIAPGGLTGLATMINYLFGALSVPPSLFLTYRCLSGAYSK